MVNDWTYGKPGKGGLMMPLKQMRMQEKDFRDKAAQEKASRRKSP